MAHKTAGISKQRIVQLAIGILWLIDGLFQLQPRMFSSSFINGVIEPSTQGQPAFVSNPIHAAMHLFLLNPVVFNSLIAVLQLAIGGLILYKPTVRYGLILSVIWGLIVWGLGEGYGGVFSGNTSLLMGAPGAALLYALIGLAVLPKKSSKSKNDNAKIAYWLAIVWLILWVGGGVYQLLPEQGTTTDVGSMVASNAEGAPSWMSSADLRVGAWLENMGPHAVLIKPEVKSNSSVNLTPNQAMRMMGVDYKTTDAGYITVVAFSLIAIAIGLGVLKGGLIRNTAIALGMFLSLCFWIFGQSMGGYFTGIATDVNSGPLYIILGYAILSCADLDKQLSRFARHLMIFKMAKRPA